MIYVIMRRGVSRGQLLEPRPLPSAVAFASGAIMAGASAGFALGWAGSLLSVGDRRAVGAVLALAALYVGFTDTLSWGRVRVLQLDRETNQLWVVRHPLGGAWATGVVIGAGLATRVGFWLWYVVPTGCFLLGRADLGAAIYATYAAVRVIVPIALAGRVALSRDPASRLTEGSLQDAMLRWGREVPLRTVCGAWLLLLAVGYLAT